MGKIHGKNRTRYVLKNTLNNTGSRLDLVLREKGLRNIKTSESCKEESGEKSSSSVLSLIEELSGLIISISAIQAFKNHSNQHRMHTSVATSAVLFLDI